MSIEQALAALTAAVQANTAALVAAGQAPAPQQTIVPTPAAPVPVQAAPVAPAMPAPPAWSPAPAAPAAPPVGGAPFANQQGLIEYATAAYHALEAQAAGKGALIEGVVKSYGLAALTDLPPAGYATFYATVEALKA